MNTLLILLSFGFLIYVLYSWFDHFRSGRYKQVHREVPVKPRLPNGLVPTLSDVKDDLSKEILDHDFDSSNDN